MHRYFNRRISNCVFNGLGCSAPGTCDSYTAFGANNIEKSAFCNTRIPSGIGKCTFVAGATKCSEAKS